MSVLRQLDEISSAVLRGEGADPAALEALCASLWDDPAQVPADKARLIVTQLERLASWATGERDTLGALLSEIGDGRRALQGYSKLQSARTAQRLFRQA
jgi:hypothetical protein